MIEPGVGVRVCVCVCVCASDWGVELVFFFECNLPLARFTCLFVIKLTLNLISSALSNFCFPKADAASMILCVFFLSLPSLYVSYCSVPSFSSLVFLLLWFRLLFMWFVAVCSGEAQYYTNHSTIERIAWPESN